MAFQLDKHLGGSWLDPLQSPQSNLKYFLFGSESCFSFSDSGSQHCLGILHIPETVLSTSWRLSGGGARS